MDALQKVIETKPDTKQIEEIYNSLNLYVTKDCVADIYHQLSEKAPYDQYVQTKEKLKNLDKSMGRAIAQIDDRQAKDKE